MGRRKAARTTCGMCGTPFLSRKARRMHQVMVHKVGTFKRGPKKGASNGKQTQPE